MAAYNKKTELSPEWSLEEPHILVELQLMPDPLLHTAQAEVRGCSELQCSLAVRGG